MPVPAPGLVPTRTGRDGDGAAAPRGAARLGPTSHRSEAVVRLSRRSLSPGLRSPACWPALHLLASLAILSKMNEFMIMLRVMPFDDAVTVTVTVMRSRADWQPALYPNDH